MSSDSEESHASAHEDNESEAQGEAEAVEPPRELQDWEEPSIPDQDDVEEEELRSAGTPDAGSNGLLDSTREVSRSERDDEHPVSELAIRSATRRPGSPESNSTPDDTPSIQVYSGR